MTSARLAIWVERLTWTLIYGGLFSAVIGLAVLDRDAWTAWPLMAVGLLLALAGVVLIWVRSRLGAARQ
jgi:hypothetical protein